MFIHTTAALLLLPLSLAAPLVEHLAPIRRAVEVGGRNPDGGYIVAIKPNTVDPNNRGRWLNSVLSAQNVTLNDDTTKSLKLKWQETVFNGLAGTFSNEALTALRKQPEVAWIQEDIEMHITVASVQVNAPWGIARLSTGTTSLAGGDPLAFGFNYTFDDTAGSGTEAYILDTGCRTTHQDFTGRARFAASFGSGARNADRNGHGTHVAGTIGGSVFGVAKQATLNCIKVMADDGSGATSDIVNGIDFASQQAVTSGRPSVISMSIGGPPNAVIDDAVRNVVNQGIPFIVAAGNDNQNADNVSPARLPEAITVGATTIDDTFASFSNFGKAVDILAPGADILSAGFNADDGVANLSGTSMATPHVAGLALLLMGKEGKLSPDALRQRITGLAISGIIQGVAAETTSAFASIQV